MSLMRPATQSLQVLAAVQRAFMDFKQTPSTKATKTKCPMPRKLGIYRATLTSVEVATSKAHKEMVVFGWETDDGPEKTYLSLASEFPLKAGLVIWESILNRIGVRSKQMHAAESLYDKGLALAQAIQKGILGKGWKLTLNLVARRQEGSKFPDLSLDHSTATLDRGEGGVVDRGVDGVVVLGIDPAPVQVPEQGIVPPVPSCVEPGADGAERGLGVELGHPQPTHEPVRTILPGDRDLVVIDWPSFCKTIAESLMAGYRVCTRPTEPEEIGHRLLLQAAAMRHYHPQEEIVLVTDSHPSWREAWLLDWCLAHGVELIRYCNPGSRVSSPWKFASIPQELEALFSQMLGVVAESIGATIVSGPGLEARDLWSMVATSHLGKVVGVTEDLDWEATAAVDNRVVVMTLAGAVMSMQDLRIKWIGGEPSAGIPGLAKRRKNGTLANRSWTQDSARTLLDVPDWEPQVDAGELARNQVLVNLPPPRSVVDGASVSVIHHQPTDTHWSRFGITGKVLYEIQSVIPPWGQSEAQTRYPGRHAET